MQALLEKLFCTATFGNNVVRDSEDKKGRFKTLVLSSPY